MSNIRSLDEKRRRSVAVTHEDLKELVDYLDDELDCLHETISTLRTRVENLQTLILKGFNDGQEN
jgi:chaperonin cofactor prefoldin